MAIEAEAAPSRNRALAFCACYEMREAPAIAVEWWHLLALELGKLPTDCLQATLKEKAQYRFDSGLSLCGLAERVGFEPTVPCGTPDFESGQIYISRC